MLIACTFMAQLYAAVKFSCFCYYINHYFITIDTITVINPINGPSAGCYQPAASAAAVRVFPLHPHAQHVQLKAPCSTFPSLFPAAFPVDAATPLQLIKKTTI